MNYKVVRLPESELYHYGVKGMKWGVRKDSRGNRDADILRNTFKKHLDDYNQTVRSYKKTYHVDSKGANSYNSSGKPVFDATRGITVYDTKKAQKAEQSKQVYERLKKQMSRKYDEVSSSASYDYETGKAAINVILKKHGKTYVSSLEDDYGEWEMPVDFITYTK